MRNECTCAAPLTLTMRQWTAKHADFKAVSRDANGRRVRYALRYCPEHGTTSVVVVIVRDGKGGK